MLDAAEAAATSMRERLQDQQAKIRHLEDYHSRLQVDLAQLHEEHAALKSRLRADRLAQVSPLEVVGLLRRAVRVVIAAVIGAVAAGAMAGPIVTFLVTDPIIGKGIEGFISAAAGATAAEYENQKSNVKESRRREGERQRISAEHEEDG